MQVVDEEGKQSTVGPEAEETPGPVSGVTKAFRMRECPVCKVSTRHLWIIKHSPHTQRTNKQGVKFETQFALFQICVPK